MPCPELEDVGARDSVRAREIEGFLARVTRSKVSPGKKKVNASIMLGEVERGEGDEDGGVATNDKAAMEKEANSANCDAGTDDLLVGYCFLNDLVEV